MYKDKPDTALHRAIEEGYYHVTEYLVKTGASLEKKNMYGKNHYFFKGDN